MPVNKVDLSTGETLIDLTGDSVTPETMLSGTTGHNAAGEHIVGVLAVQTVYFGAADPDASIGEDGDIYIKTTA